jgi:hypothetical protein
LGPFSLIEQGKICHQRWSFENAFPSGKAFTGAGFRSIVAKNLTLKEFPGGATNLSITC